MKGNWTVFLLLAFLCGCSESQKGIETEKQQSQKVQETKVIENQPVEKEGVVQKKKGPASKKAVTESTQTEIEEECIFDLKTQTDSFIKNIPEFANYRWIERSKTAAIQLENGDSVYAHRGGCYHFGIDAEWIQQTDSTIHNTVYWLQQATWLAEKIYHPSLLEEFKEKLRVLDYEITPDKNRWVITIHHDYYSEWWITATLRPDGKTVLSTGYYFG